MTPKPIVIVAQNSKGKVGKSALQTLIYHTVMEQDSRSPGHESGSQELLPPRVIRK